MIRNRADKTGKPSGKRERLHKSSILLVLYDIIAICTSYYLALFFRFEGLARMIPPVYLRAYRTFILPYAVCSVGVFYLLRMYQSVWRFAGFYESLSIFFGSILTSVLHYIVITLLFRRMPISYHVIGALLQCEWRRNFHSETAPLIADDMRYLPNPGGKEIRVYDYVDVRFLFEDLYAKLKLFSQAE